MYLVWPSESYLPGYIDALRRGWSADNVRGEVAANEELAMIAKDSGQFLRELVDRDGKARRLYCPMGPQRPGCLVIDAGYGMGSSVEVSVSVGNLAHLIFRLIVLAILASLWCHGSVEMAMQPWRLKNFSWPRGTEGLVHVELTTDPTNIASQRVIEKNGGRLVERFIKPAQYENVEGLRFRIELNTSRSGL